MHERNHQIVPKDQSQHCADQKQRRAAENHSQAALLGRRPEVPRVRRAATVHPRPLGGQEDVRARRRHHFRGVVSVGSAEDGLFDSRGAVNEKFANFLFLFTFCLFFCPFFGIWLF